MHVRVRLRASSGRALHLTFIDSSVISRERANCRVTPISRFVRRTRVRLRASSGRALHLTLYRPENDPARKGQMLLFGNLTTR